MAFTNLFWVCVVAVAAPVLVDGVRRWVLVPALVLELLAGIVLGPSGLSLVRVDDPVRVLAEVGLAMLLFLAGLEIDPRSLRGPLARRAALHFGASLAAAGVLGGLLRVGGVVHSAPFAAIMLASTALGVVAPVLVDAGRSRQEFGQLIIAAASIADLACVVLLSALFSSHQSGTGHRLGVLALFLAAVTVLLAAGRLLERRPHIRALLAREADTTAQLRVRVTGAVLIGLVVVDEQLGLETILGAFAAGLLVSILDDGGEHDRAHYRLKLTAVGEGVFVPVFFVATGLTYDLGALTASTSAIVHVPLFLAALLLARGVPTLLLAPALGVRRTLAGALLLSTSLPVIVAATEIGRQLGLITAATAAGLVAAGVLSVLLFPAGALSLLRGERRSTPLPGSSASAAVAR